MRKIGIWLASLLFMLSEPALAQTRVFLSGDVFADAKRFSGDTALRRNATSIGGGGNVGLLVTERWDVRAEVGVGDTTTTTRPLLPPITTFQARTRSRITASSALVGFHPVSGPRVQFIVLAGLSFLHVKTQFDSIPSGLVIKHTEIDNVAAPTIGAEVPITLFRHVSVVFGLRAHAFTLSKDKAGGFAIRPGFGIRWSS